MSTRCNERVVVRIANIVFAMSSEQPIELIRLEDAYRDFLCTGEPEVTIRASYTGLPQIPLRNEDRVFDSEMVWSLYRSGGRNILALKSPVSGPLPYRIAAFDDDFRHGEVYNLNPESDPTQDGFLSNPLEFPLSEVLMVCLLARGRGLMIHACGIDDGGRGYLFAGNSTHGKSTMAGLWKDEGLILNDDRIVLRLHDGHFWMHGTPWHGDYTDVSPQGVPLERVFFLRHEEANRTDRKEDATAATMLLTRCFPPLWDEEGMRFTLDFCAQLVADVPCYELGFVPDMGIVDFVRTVK